MATITHSPTGWHGTDTAANAPDTVQLRIATQTALDVVTGSNAGTLATAEGRITTLSTGGVIRVPVSLTANGTWATYVEMPQAATVTAIAVLTPTVFASTGGTVLLTAKKTNNSGNTMLAAATYDLETPLANVRTGLSLTATPADLAIAANGLIYLAVVSNNADATGPAAAAGAISIAYTLAV